MALLGLLVTVHLMIQQGRGFDRGCLGFTTSAAVEATFDCNAVVTSGAGKLLGVSNAVWGFLFYVVVAALSAVIAFVSGQTLTRLKVIRALLIVFGFLYSVFLVSYQYIAVREFCALCLMSALVALALFVIQAVAYFRSERQNAKIMTGRNFKREATLFASLAALTILIAGADYAYFDRLEATPAVAMNEPVMDATTGEPIPGCAYDAERAPLRNYLELVNFSDPARGKAGSPVTVIEFFEPNCGHCRALFPVMEEVAKREGEQARFYYKPVVFWPDRSLAQVEALHAAAQEGKYFEMLERQFALQDPRTGLSRERLKEVAAEIGMDPKVLGERFDTGLYRGVIQRETEQAVNELGINSVPAVTINGRFVAGTGRTVECMTELIKQAAAKK